MKRRVGQGAGGEQHTGVKKESHFGWLSEKPFMSASSSAIQASTCSRVNSRGAGKLPPCDRRRAAINSSNCCFSAAGNASTAASISASVLMSEVYPFPESRTSDVCGPAVLRPVLRPCRRATGVVAGLPTVPQAPLAPWERGWGDTFPPLAPRERGWG